MSATPTYEVLVLGSPKCGRSSLIYTFNEGYFPSSDQLDHYHTRMYNPIPRPRIIDGVECIVTPRDVSSNTQSPMLASHIRSCHGYVLVADVSDPSSLSPLEDVYADIIRELDCEHVGTSCPVVVCGAKTDCDRALSEAEGEAFARSLGSGHPYVEVSSKLGLGVDLVFDTIVRTIRTIRTIRTHRDSHSTPSSTSRKCVLS